MAIRHQIGLVALEFTPQRLDVDEAAVGSDAGALDIGTRKCLLLAFTVLANPIAVRRNESLEILVHNRLSTQGERPLIDVEDKHVPIACDDKSPLIGDGRDIVRADVPVGSTPLLMLMPGMVHAVSQGGIKAELLGLVVVWVPLDGSVGGALRSIGRMITAGTPENRQLLVPDHSMHVSLTRDVLQDDRVVGQGLVEIVDQNALPRVGPGGGDGQLVVGQGFERVRVPEEGVPTGCGEQDLLVILLERGVVDDDDQIPIDGADGLPAVHEFHIGGIVGTGVEGVLDDGGQLLLDIDPGETPADFAGTVVDGQQRRVCVEAGCDVLEGLTIGARLEETTGTGEWERMDEADQATERGECVSKHHEDFP